MSVSNRFESKKSYFNIIKDMTLKDVDLLNLVSKNLLSISVPPKDADLIIKTIVRDTEFFKA